MSPPSLPDLLLHPVPQARLERERQEVAIQVSGVRREVSWVGTAFALGAGFLVGAASAEPFSAALLVLLLILPPIMALETRAQATLSAVRGGNARAIRHAEWRGFIPVWVLGCGLLGLLAAFAYPALPPGAARVSGSLGAAIGLLAAFGVFGLYAEYRLGRLFRRWQQGRPAPAAAYAQAMTLAQRYPEIETFRQGLRRFNRDYLTVAEAEPLAELGALAQGAAAPVSETAARLNLP